MPSHLLDDLLDVSRISYGKLTLRPERVALAEIITRAAETSQPLRDEAEQTFEVFLPIEAIFLYADPVRLEQVFANLLNNAAKYSGRGSHVVLSARAEGESVIVSVRDNGVGIPSDRLADIFEMFSQVKPAAGGPQGGLGIGLSLVQGLVQLHSGEVEARSDGDGKGSEFIVRLPLPSPAEVKAQPAAVDETGEMVAVAADTPLRLLVADDLHDTADSLTAYLRSANHEVRTVYDGAGALAEAATFRPDIIFLDIGMPKLNGHDVCRRIRDEEWGEKTIIVALTGWGQGSDRRLTTEAGFDEHLVKPVAIGDLLTIMSAATLKKAGA